MGTDQRAAIGKEVPGDISTAKLFPHTANEISLVIEVEFVAIQKVTIVKIMIT